MKLLASAGGRLRSSGECSTVRFCSGRCICLDREADYARELSQKLTFAQTFKLELQPCVLAVVTDHNTRHQQGEAIYGETSLSKVPAMSWAHAPERLLPRCCGFQPALAQRLEPRSSPARKYRSVDMSVVLHRLVHSGGNRPKMALWSWVQNNSMGGSALPALGPP